MMIKNLGGPTPPYLEAFLIVLCSILNVFTTHWFYFSVQHVGMRVRVACSCLIYRKVGKWAEREVGHVIIHEISVVYRYFAIVIRILCTFFDFQLICCIHGIHASTVAVIVIISIFHFFCKVPSSAAVSRRQAAQFALE
jgi:hypothetical protein